MKTKNWDLRRRDLLKSLGIGAACLPVLSSSRVWGDDGGNFKRFAIIHGTAGYWMQNWRPMRDGPLAGQTLPSSSSPLQPHADDVVFLHSMTNPEYKVGDNWGHECYGTIYWGGPQKAPGGSKYQEPNGKTLDQHIAEGLPKTSRLSLNFDVQIMRQPRSGTAGSVRCFWRGAGQPINPESNPTKTYQSIFAGLAPTPGAMPGMPSAPDPAVSKLLASKKSILDYVGKSLEKFRVRVGREDKGAIDGHLTSVRELEGQLSGIGQGGSMLGPVAAMNPGNFTDEQILADAKLFPDIMDAYMNMMLVALRSGITRVATLQLANASGNQLNFGAFLGDRGIPARGTGYKSAFRNWHDLGHNPIFMGQNHKIIVDKWCMEKFAGFIQKMKDIQEPGGTMLRNSLVLWGNHMESGDNHHSQRIPWVLAGRAGGDTLKVGTVTGAGKTISSAMGDICRAMGVAPQAHWSGSAGAT
jgi:hypothetical protein